MFVEKMFMEKMFVKKIFVKEMFVRKKFMKKKFVKKIVIPGDSSSAKEITDHLWETFKQFWRRKTLDGAR